MVLNDPFALTVTVLPFTFSEAIPSGSLARPVTSTLCTQTLPGSGLRSSILGALSLSVTVSVLRTSTSSSSSCEMKSPSYQDAVSVERPCMGVAWALGESKLPPAPSVALRVPAEIVSTVAPLRFTPCAKPVGAKMSEPIPKSMSASKL